MYIYNIVCEYIFTVSVDIFVSTWLFFVVYLQGPTIPAMNALLAQWVPIGERSRIGSFVFAGKYTNPYGAVTIYIYIFFFGAVRPLLIASNLEHFVRNQ